MENQKPLKGGEFLTKEIEAKDIFIPEDFDEEQIMVKQTCEDFLETDPYWNGYVFLKPFGWKDLIPDNSKTLQVIVDGIIEKKPFILC